MKTDKQTDFIIIHQDFVKRCYWRQGVANETVLSSSQNNI